MLRSRGPDQAHVLCQRIKIKWQGKSQAGQVTAWKFSTKPAESVAEESFHWGTGNTAHNR